MSMMMPIPSRALRWLQIGLTLFYGQVMSNGIYQYFLLGIAGLAHRQRSISDSLFLFFFGLFLMFFVIYAIMALWYEQIRTSAITWSLLIVILTITLVNSIYEIIFMAKTPLRTEWMAIRISELVLRVFGIVGSLLFIVRLKQGHRAADL